MTRADAWIHFASMSCSLHGLASERAEQAAEVADELLEEFDKRFKMRKSQPDLADEVKKD